MWLGCSFILMAARVPFKICWYFEFMRPNRALWRKTTAPQHHRCSTVLNHRDYVLVCLTILHFTPNLIWVFVEKSSIFAPLPLEPSSKVPALSSKLQVLVCGKVENKKILFFLAVEVVSPKCNHRLQISNCNPWSNFSLCPLLLWV